MTQANPLALDRRDGLPDALRLLVQDCPRADWSRHGNFGGLVSFWMERHVMFRKLTEVLRQDVERYLDRQIGFDAYAPRLSRFGGTLLNELHGHHQIEDAHYFPQLVRLEPRLERGFDLLETDHEAMDGLLAGLADGANAVLQAGPKGDAAGAFAKRLEDFNRLLDRHLLDEEELVVPVVLATGFQG